MTDMTSKTLMKPYIKPILFLWTLMIILSVYLDDMRIFYSSTLGIAFSFWAFRNLIQTQSKILNQGKERFFLPFINRLLIYAVPISLGLSKKDHFNLWIILIFLWSFHILFIAKEFVDNYRKYKEKLRDGKYR